MMNKERFYRTYPIFGLALFLIALLVPMCMSLVPSLITAKGLGIQEILRTFTNMDYLKTMAFTAVFAFANTVICTLLGWCGASILTRYNLGGEGFLKGLYGFAIIIPSAVTAIGTRLLLAEGGFLQALFNIPGINDSLILIAFDFIVYFTPIEILVVSYYWRRLDFRCEKAARTLGVSASKAFRTVTLPRLRPAIIAGACLVFLACLTNFSSIVILDSCEVINTANSMVFRCLEEPSTAACFAAVNMVLGLIALAVFCTLQKKMASRISSDTSCHREKTNAKGFFRNLFLFIYSLLSIILILTPVMSIIAEAFVGENLELTVSNFVELFGSLEAIGIRPIAYSFAIAIASSFLASRIAVALAISIYRKQNGKVSNGLLALSPLCIGSVVLGFGFRVLSSYVPQIPSIALVAISHVAMLTPISVMAVSPVFAAIRSDLVPASRTLGYSAAATFRNIEKPAIRPAVSAGFMFSLAISFGDVGSALTIAGRDAKTIAVLLFSEYTNGNLGYASALGCILIVICFIVYLIGEKLIRKCHV